MKSRIKSLEKKIIPNKDLPKVVEIIMPHKSESREDYVFRVEKRRKYLIKKHGKKEFLKGTFLVLQPAEWTWQ